MSLDFLLHTQQQQLRRRRQQQVLWQQLLPTTPQQATARPALPGSFSPMTTNKVLTHTHVCKYGLATSPKKQRKSRVVYNFSLETLEQYFHLSQRDAAKCLGVAPITLKRNCKRHGIMWPFRTNKQHTAYAT